MSDTLHDALRSLYAGPYGDLWDRLETRRPAGYLEQNLVIGRQRADDVLCAWLEPETAPRILEVGCGRGDLSRRLAAAGAHVVATDVLGRLPEAGADVAPGSLALVAADGLEPLAPPHEQPFDVLVAREVLEDHAPEARYEVLGKLLRRGVDRVVLGMRVEGSWSGLWERLAPDASLPTLDPVAILRWIHLNTPFRQTRHKIVQVRNYRAWLSELHREDDPLATRFD